MKKLLVKTALLVGVAILVVGPATPASAHDGVAVLQGNANTSNLGFPILTNPGTGTWSIGTATCTGVSAAGLGSCSLTASGTLLPVASPLGVEIGPGCGLSKGVSGPGSTFSTTPGDTHPIHIDWITSAGTIIPITGYAEDGSGGSDGGMIVSLTRASANPEPVTPCLNGNANSFAVVSVTAVI